MSQKLEGLCLNLNNFTLSKIVEATSICLASSTFLTGCLQDFRHLLPPTAPQAGHQNLEQVRIQSQKHADEFISSHSVYMPVSEADVIKKAMKTVYEKERVLVANPLLPSTDENVRNGDCNVVLFYTKEFIRKLDLSNVDKKLVLDTQNALNYSLTAAAYNGVHENLIKAHNAFNKRDYNSSIHLYNKAKYCVDMLSEFKIRNLDKTAPYNDISTIKYVDNEYPKGYTVYKVDKNEQIMFLDLSRKITRIFKESHKERKIIPDAMV
jgi:hypothetical protein